MQAGRRGYKLPIRSGTHNAERESQGKQESGRDLCRVQQTCLDGIDGEPQGTRGRHREELERMRAVREQRMASAGLRRRLRGSPRVGQFSQRRRSAVHLLGFMAQLVAEVRMRNRDEFVVALVNRFSP
jgi:hypothetical protein